MSLGFNSQDGIQDGSNDVACTYFNGGNSVVSIETGDTLDYEFEPPDVRSGTHDYTILLRLSNASPTARCSTRRSALSSEA